MIDITMYFKMISNNRIFAIYFLVQYFYIATSARRVVPLHTIIKKINMVLQYFAFQLSVNPSPPVNVYPVPNNRMILIYWRGWSPRAVVSARSCGRNMCKNIFMIPYRGRKLYLYDSVISDRAFNLLSY